MARSPRRVARQATVPARARRDPLTTNKPVREWRELPTGNAVPTTASLDRLLHEAHVLNFERRGDRLRDVEQARSIRRT